MSEEPALLTRDELLTPVKRRFATIGPLPVRGGFVRVRSLTEQEASEYEEGFWFKGERSRARMIDANARYLTLVLVDQAGNRLLGPGDVGALLKNWDRADIEHAYTEARAHVSAKRRSIEDLEKNCDATPAGN